MTRCKTANFSPIYTRRCSSTAHAATRRTLLTLAFLGFFWATGSAQEIAGNLTGRGLTGTGEPLQDTQVAITGSSLQGVRTARTNPRGYFRVQGLPVGVYTVKMVRIGYRSVTLERVPIQLGRTTTLGEIRLEAQPVELPPLVVSGDRPLIDPASTSIGANLESSTFEALPTERNYRSIIALLPHANTSFLGDETNIAGSTGPENAYYIDGVNVTEPWGHETGMDLPYNFIKAIEVKEGGYEAEHGNALGGMVNVVTYSGGNEFEGRALGFFTNSAFAGASRPGVADLREDRFATYDVGMSLGGPIVRDRVWFFTAYNPSFERRDIEVPGFGFRDDSRTKHMFAGKITWQVNDATDLALTLLGDPATRHAVSPPPTTGPIGVTLGNPDPFLFFAKSGGVSLSLRGQFRLTPNHLLDVAAYRYATRLQERGETDRGRTEPVFFDQTTGTLSGGFGSTSDLRNRRTAASVTGTVYLGNHDVKWGGQYQDNFLDFLFRWTDPGSISKGGDSFYQALVFTQDIETRTRVPSFFLQDSWHVLDRLRLNLGLRWDGLYVVAFDKNVVQSFTSQFQPRVGIVFQPGELGRQKLYASYGRYYQQHPTSTTQAYGGLDNRLLFYSVDPRTYPDSIDFALVFADPCCAVVTGDPGAAGEQLDEFVVGYERAGSRLKFTVRGIHRVLRDAFANGFEIDPDPSVVDCPTREFLGCFVLGNPGRGLLDFLPPYDRKYTAGELRVEWVNTRANIATSYVLSRAHGNYTGKYNSDARETGQFFSLQLESQIPNSSGLLPNDRTHVAKLFGSYRFDVGLTVGVFFTWGSGTPLNEFGQTALLFRPIFLRKRGSAGRTPGIWDLNLRLTYRLPNTWRGTSVGRVILDLLHIGSPRKVVDVDQVSFNGVDVTQVDLTSPYEELVANQTAPNPNFGSPLRHQPPMTVRLGVELEF